MDYVTVGFRLASLKGIRRLPVVLHVFDDYDYTC